MVLSGGGGLESIVHLVNEPCAPFETFLGLDNFALIRLLRMFFLESSDKSRIDNELQ